MDALRLALKRDRDRGSFFAFTAIVHDDASRRRAGRFRAADDPRAASCAILFSAFERDPDRAAARAPEQVPFDRWIRWCRSRVDARLPRGPHRSDGVRARHRTAVERDDIIAASGKDDVCRTSIASAGDAGSEARRGVGDSAGDAQREAHEGFARSSGDDCACSKRKREGRTPRSGRAHRRDAACPARRKSLIDRLRVG